MRTRIFWAWNPRALERFRALMLGGGLVAAQGWACGFDFVPMLVLGGDEALVVAPVAQFRSELVRLKLAPVPFASVRPTNGYAEQTAQMERRDLEEALRHNGVGPERAPLVLADYESARSAGWLPVRGPFDKLRAGPGQVARSGQQPGAMPGSEPPPIPGSVPAEFADYLRGARAWQAGKTNEARQCWQMLLSRPPAARRFRSTWAAFMLGRSFAETDRLKAIDYYRQVRELATAGFVDSLGLAESSLGWEAQVEYLRGGHERAIELYLEQLVSGDESAVVSLRWVAADALRGRVRALRGLASHRLSRQVITAYVIAGGFGSGPVDVDGPVREAAATLLSRAKFLPAPAKGWHSMQNPAVLWLRALEAAGVQNVEAAERLALAAYQCGDFDLAQRWIARCAASPIARWLQAKLRLREGRVREAAELLAGLTREFPVKAAGTNIPGRPAWSLEVSAEQSAEPPVISGHQILGELGVLRLAQREYAEALDCLLRAGFWADAAYVAERVLTIDELRQFTDSRWPEEAGGGTPGVSRGLLVEARALPRTARENLRYLLGRRLTRNQRGTEATGYYPAELRSEQVKYVEYLQAAEAPERTASERAAALWAAAQMAREKGMELLGTELAPDWRIEEGRLDQASPVWVRAANVAFARASWEEVRRARDHGPTPEERFHYRYLAAALAWAAAELMPNHSEETARVLCTAGRWLKDRDPEAADVFYKALIRRCGQTPLGRAADRRRWFPEP